MQSRFRLFFSFDYNGGTEGAWTQDAIIEILKTYAANDCYFQYDNKAFVSTFEGTTTDQINAWPSIREEIPGGLYFVPDWTSLGPNGFDTSLVDGACMYMCSLGLMSGYISLTDCSLVGHVARGCAGYLHYIGRCLGRRLFDSGGQELHDGYERHFREAFRLY